MSERKTLTEITEEIRHTWPDIPVPARFYLEDMEAIVEDDYLPEPGVILIKLFLNNADQWKGTAAELLKEELCQYTLY